MGGLIARFGRWLTSTFAVLLDRLASVGLIQSGVVLAAYTFLALLPLLIVAIAFLPAGISDAIAVAMRDRVGLAGSEPMVQGVINNRDSLRGGISIFGVVVAVASATSFTRALQRIYELSWGLPRLGLRGSLRGLAWLIGMIIYVGVISTAVQLTGDTGVGPPIRFCLLAVAAVVLWWWTPFVLLLGRVRLRALVPSGLITGAVVTTLGAFSAVIVPRTLESNERQFGTIGAIFALESWLVIVGCAIVAAAVVSAVLSQLPGPLGRIA